MKELPEDYSLQQAYNDILGLAAYIANLELPERVQELERQMDEVRTTLGKDHYRKNGKAPF